MNEATRAYIYRVALAVLAIAATGAPPGGIAVNRQGAWALDVFGGDPGFVAL